MQLQDFYPIIVTEHLAACRDFYRRWFEFEAVFEATWFVLLGPPGGRGASLAFMHPAHPSAPPGPEIFSGMGMCLEFQVADAAAEYARFQDGGAPIQLTMRDEPFGQRRFGLFDPADSSEPAQATRARSGFTKKCPDCAEIIKLEAKVCRFCKRQFTDREVEAQIEQARSTLWKPY